jgi:hypothetical protein
MTSRRAIARGYAVAAALGLTALAGAQSGARSAPAPEVPEAIRAPAGERLVLRTRASGVQIYVCAAAADGGLQWTLKAPDAELRDARGTIVIHHFAGPAWKDNDGSEVTARAVAHSDAPDHASIAWLLLEAVSHNGNGILTPVAHIQRVHTHGGLPPPAAGCNAAKRNSEVRVAYTADYYFYAAAVK